MLKILVVDDSMIMRKKIITILTELGHEVSGEAETGEEAIVKYEKIKPDFVTMDVTMAEMNGIEATKILKEKYPDMKLVIVTSHGQENLVRQAIKYGAKGYILKPVTSEKIENIMSKIFNIKKEKKIDISKSGANDFLNGTV